MSELMQLIDDHLREYGVRQNAFARLAGMKHQTLSAWRKGLSKLPEAEHLRGVARELHVPYRRVLDAVLVDIGYLSRNEAEMMGSVLDRGAKWTRGQGQIEKPN